MANLTIELTTSADGMGDGWTDEDAANEVFAEWMESQLVRIISETYPEHDTEVSVTAVEAGGQDSICCDDDDIDTDKIRHNVNDMCQALFGEFCQVAVERYPELIAA
jgi:hypothetical protein